MVSSACTCRNAPLSIVAEMRLAARPTVVTAVTTDSSVRAIDARRVASTGTTRSSGAAQPALNGARPSMPVTAGADRQAGIESTGQASRRVRQATSSSTITVTSFGSQPAGSGVVSVRVRLSCSGER